MSDTDDNLLNFQPVFLPIQARVAAVTAVPSSLGSAQILKLCLAILVSFSHPVRRHTALAAAAVQVCLRAQAVFC